MKPNIHVKVRTQFLAEQSIPEANRYVFAYHIEIHNHGDQSATLVARHWIITDSNNNRQEVKGQGVIGEQPLIDPGKYFAYSSGAVLETPIGVMQGFYSMVADDGSEFLAEIAPFTLSIPRTLH